MKYYITFLILLFFLESCKKEEYDFHNKYFKLEPTENLKTDTFGFNLHQVIKGIAFYKDKIFINTYNDAGYEMKESTSEQITTNCYRFGKGINAFIICMRTRPDTFGIITYNNVDYEISKISNINNLKTNKLPSYNQIKQYADNGCVIGKVKKTILKKYEIKIAFDEYVMTEIAEEICNYDTTGKLIQHTIYEIKDKNKPKILKAQYTYKYNKQNKISYTYKKFGYVETAFNYNDFINPICSKDSGEEVYKYNTQGSLIKIERKNNSLFGNETEIEERIYIQDSLLSEINTFNSKHDLISKIKIKYKDGKIFQAIRYTGTGERNRIWTYNKNGALISNIPYHNTKETTWGWRQDIKYSNTIYLKNIYNGDSRNGKYYNEDVMYYDIYGNILKKYSTREVKSPSFSYSNMEDYKESNKEIYTYIFDKSGNWTKLKIKNSNNELPIIVKRHIEYF